MSLSAYRCSIDSSHFPKPVSMRDSKSALPLPEYWEPD